MSIQPTAEDFDNMLHALGRPKDLTKETYRNNFCTERDGPTAKRFEALGFWQLTHFINDGRNAVYAVNAAGRAALRSRPPIIRQAEGKGVIPNDR